MKAMLYYNESNKNVVNKTITTDLSNDITVHFKDDTNMINPVIYISREIDMRDYNYILIKGFNNRYYYIESVEVSQQMYIVKCHVDVLMTYKSAIKNQTCIVTRNSNHYNMYLNDDKLKLNNMSRVETIKFPNGFRVNGSKTFNFVLTINGGGNNSNSGGDN